MLTIEEKEFRAKLLHVLRDLSDEIKENNKLLKEINGNLSEHITENP